MRPHSFSSTDLSLLQAQLDSWRRRQSGRRRLPPELWDAAARLAHSRGVSLVSRTLRIDFHKVRRQLDALPVRVPVDAAASRFVELKLDPPRWPGTQDGWVELSDGAGRRMRIHTGLDRTSWIALAESFWRAGS